MATKTKATKATKATRTPRLRYMEPPTKKDGNPFLALRVPSALLRGFKAYARKVKATPTELVRAYMSKASGVPLEVEGDDEGEE